MYLKVFCQRVSDIRAMPGVHYYALVALLLFVQCYSALALTFKTSEDYAYPEAELEALAVPIAERCHFTEDWPVELITDGETLKARLTEKPEARRQYLLIDDITLTGSLSETKQNFNLCGIRDWLSEKQENAAGNLASLIRVREGDPRATLNISSMLVIKHHPVELNHLVLVRPEHFDTKSPLLYTLRSDFTMRHTLIDDSIKSSVDESAKVKYSEKILINEFGTLHAEDAEIRTSVNARYRECLWTWVGLEKIFIDRATMMVRSEGENTAVCVLIWASYCIRLQDFLIKVTAPEVSNKGFVFSCFYETRLGGRQTPIFIDNLRLQGSIRSGIHSYSRYGRCWFQTGENAITMNSTHQDAQGCTHEPESHIGDIHFSDGYTCKGIAPSSAGLPDHPERCYFIDKTDISHPATIQASTSTPDQITETPPEYSCETLSGSRGFTPFWLPFFREPQCYEKCFDPPSGH